MYQARGQALFLHPSSVHLHRGPVLGWVLGRVLVMRWQIRESTASQSLQLGSALGEGHRK